MNLIDSCYNHQFHVTCLFYVFVLCHYHQYHGVLVRWRCSCGDRFTCNCPILVLNKVYYYYYYYYYFRSMSLVVRALVGMVMFNPETTEIAKPSELLNGVRSYMSVLQGLENYGADPFLLPFYPSEALLSLYLSMCSSFCFDGLLPPYLLVFLHGDGQLFFHSGCASL